MVAIFADRQPASLERQYNDAAPLLQVVHVLMYLGDCCFRGEADWMRQVKRG